MDTPVLMLKNEWRKISKFKTNGDESGQNKLNVKRKLVLMRSEIEIKRVVVSRSTVPPALNDANKYWRKTLVFQDFKVNYINGYIYPCLSFQESGMVRIIIRTASEIATKLEIIVVMREAPIIIVIVVPCRTVVQELNDIHM